MRICCTYTISQDISQLCITNIIYFISIRTECTLPIRVNVPHRVVPRVVVQIAIVSILSVP